MKKQVVLKDIYILKENNLLEKYLEIKQNKTYQFKKERFIPCLLFF